MERLKNIPLLPLLIPVLLTIVALILSVSLYFTISKSGHPTRQELISHIDKNGLDIRSSVIDGHQQVLYVYEGREIQISEGSNNHKNPRSSGQYIVWEESPSLSNVNYIMLYDVLSRTKTQLTFHEKAQKPNLYGNRVVWEELSQNKVKIMYYDGITTRSITDGSLTSVNPYIYKDLIVFSRPLSPEKWQAVVYNLANNTEKILTEDVPGRASPRFIEGKIVLDNPR